VFLRTDCGSFCFYIFIQVIFYEQGSSWSEEKSMKKALWTILSMLFFLSACMLPVNTITVFGSGKPVSESRMVKGINRVELAAPGDLKIIQGEEEGLVITAENNLMPHIQTTINGSTLKIHMPENITLIPTRELTYILKVKRIGAIYNSSSGSVIAEKLNSPELEVVNSSGGAIQIDSLISTRLQVKLSSSGNVSLQGQVDNQDVLVSSSGNYFAPDLHCLNAQVNLSSSGSVFIWVVKKLNVQLSGAGKVDYYGNPEVISQISGSGHLNSLGDHP